MNSARLFPLMAALACLVFVASSAHADEDSVPSFKKATNRDTKEFVTKVGTAIIKAARSKPQKIELTKYDYEMPKANRRELKIKMNYSGLVTKLKYTVDITVKIDSSDKEKWEVLDIDYKDSNKSPVGPSLKKIRELIKVLNKE